MTATRATRTPRARKPAAVPAVIPAQAEPDPAAVRAAAIAAYRTSLVAAMGDRAAYELGKDPGNDNIQSTIADLRKSVDHDMIAYVMLVAELPAGFINISERRTARFNVYSAQKVVNIARAVAAAERINHYSRAILLSAIALQNAGLAMTHADAAAACSLSVRTSPSREKLLVKYGKHVAPNTASTQSSSSLNALRMMNVIGETRSADNETCYLVDLASPITEKLLTRV